jgi:hypothetical protein
LALVFGFMAWSHKTAAGAPRSPTSLAFAPAATGEFTFDTGLLKGMLRAGGKSAGLSSVVHIPRNLRLDSSMGLLSHYRVFTANKRYGTAAWDWPSQARLQNDGAVTVTWPEAPERPFTMQATYRWLAPDSLEVDTRVIAIARLEGFEAFLASYFSPSFTNSMVYAASPQGSSFVHALQTAGSWQSFPRDSKSVALFGDGRWKIEPHPVEWVMMSNLANPIGVRRAPAEEVTAAICSRSEDCFAVSTPQETDNHYSLYFSLFGRDLKPGEKAKAKTCLVVRTNASEEVILQDWKQFAAE